MLAFHSRPEARGTGRTSRREQEAAARCQLRHGRPERREGGVVFLGVPGTVGRDKEGEGEGKRDTPIPQKTSRERPLGVGRPFGACN